MVEKKKHNKIIIQNINIIPMTNEQVLRDKNIFIENGIIKFIGDGNDEIDPGFKKSALIIKAKNCYVIPGLIDMHTHIQSSDDFLLYLANGVTTIRNMAGTHDNINRKQQIAAGETCGPSIFTCGPILEGQNPVFPFSTIVNTKARVRGVIGRLKNMEFDFIKVLDSLDANIYEDIIQIAAEKGMPVIGHVPTEVGLKKVLELRAQLSIEHLHGFAGFVQKDDSPFAGKYERLSVWPSKQYDHIDENKIDIAAQLIKDSGIWSCPTIVVMQKLVSVDTALDWVKNKKLHFFDPMYREMLWWDPYKTKDYDDNFFNSVNKKVDYCMKFARALHVAGAKIVIGTDAPNPFVIPGFSINEEIKNFQLLGFSPYEILQAATVNAAECLKQSSNIGSVTVGKTADLIILKKNPLEDIGNLDTKQGVVVKGSWYAIDEMNKLLENRYHYYKSTSYMQERKLIEHIDDEVPIQDCLDLLKEYLKNIQKSDINRLSILNDRIALLLFENRNDHAVKIAEQLLSFYPDAYYTYILLGDACLKNGNKQHAVRNYEKSLKYQPANVLASKKINIENPVIYIEDIS